MKAKEYKVKSNNKTELYSWDRDYSFLKICQFGQLTNNTVGKLDNPINIDPPRAFDPPSSHVPSSTFHGRRPTGILHQGAPGHRKT